MRRGGQALVVAAALLLAGCSGDRDVRIFRVPSSSMEPTTLHCAKPAAGCEATREDLVAVRPYSHAPRRRDIVVFHTPPLARLKCGAGGTFIKRLIGLPGETWSERSGFIFIDGRTLAEPYLQPGRRDSQTLKGGPIPANRCLLLGDNRASSCDSRVYGLVPRGDLIGRVFEIKRGSKQIDIR